MSKGGWIRKRSRQERSASRHDLSRCLLGPRDRHLARRPRRIEPRPERSRVHQLHRVEELGLYAVLTVVAELAPLELVSLLDVKLEEEFAGLWRARLDGRAVRLVPVVVTHAVILRRAVTGWDYQSCTPFAQGPPKFALIS